MVDAVNITMIMPNYNDADCIERAVGGVFALERKPDELIIIDDGSTDNSVHILQSLVERHPHIKLILCERNRGVVHAFNRALEEVKTEYVCFASMDDGMEPSWLARSAEMLSLCPQAGICCSDLYQHYPDGSIAPLGLTNHICKEPSYFSGRDFAHVIDGGYIAGTTVVVKKEALMELGAYRPELRWHSDWFAWLVIAMRYGVCVIPECLVTLLVRDTSHSQVGMQVWSDQTKVLKHIFRLLNTAEFRDIYPHFVWGKLMGHFSTNAVKVILENPELWTQTNLLLVDHLLPKLPEITGQRG